jgi:hypothetical protein
LRKQERSTRGGLKDDLKTELKSNTSVENALVQKQWILDIHLTGMCLNLLALKEKKKKHTASSTKHHFHIVQLKIPSSSLFTSKAPILPWLNTRKRPTYRWFDFTQLFLNSCDVTVLKQKENTVS